MMILSHDCSMIKYESNKKLMFLSFVYNNIGFPVKTYQH
jgi:hypothetical protein